MREAISYFCYIWLWAFTIVYTVAIFVPLEGVTIRWFHYPLTIYFITVCIAGGWNGKPSSTFHYHIENKEI